jgi:hypothetical protein
MPSGVAVLPALAPRVVGELLDVGQAAMPSRPAWLLSCQTATMLPRSLNGWRVDAPAAGLVADTALALVA